MFKHIHTIFVLAYDLGKIRAFINIVFIGPDNLLAISRALKTEQEEDRKEITRYA
jgi:hypothetical protein